MTSEAAASVYRLHACAGTASFAPQMVLEEASLPHERLEVDISRGAHRTAEFLAINPAGKVPALVLPGGDILTEAAAICLYLADFHRLPDLAPGADDADRPRFLKWLFYLATSVQDQYKRIYYPERYSTDPADAGRIKVRAQEMLFECWQVIEDDLAAGGPYLLGERFSLADIYLVMLASWFPDQQGFRGRFPAVSRAFDLVAERPVVRRGLAGQVVSVGSAAP